MSFRFSPLEIPGPHIVEAETFEDSRGHFIETYRNSEFGSNAISDRFVQDNWTRSRYGVLRGLHFQRAPKAQAKLITVIRGEIFDVAVDIRNGSPTYGRWMGINLSEREPKMLYLPVGFAHGFCVLSDIADVLYKVTAEYDPDLDTGIFWDDPAIGIRWPIDKPLLSAKDARLPRLRDTEPL
jgi:dTDP-4-dehydrorhamnose 3,5-epimerase